MTDLTMARYLVHGIELNVNAASSYLFQLLDEDYGDFRIPETQPIDADLKMTVNVMEEPITELLADAFQIRSDVGDTVWVGSDCVNIFGKAVYSKKGYERSVRAYLTTFLSNLASERLGLNRYHGSAVSIDGNGILFFGQGGAGKTSIALKCVLEGASYLSHEYIFIDDRKDTLFLLGLPQAVTLGKDAIEWFGIENPARSSSQLSKFMFGPVGHEKMRLPVTTIDRKAQVALKAPLCAAVLLQPNFNLTGPRWIGMAPDASAAMLMQAVEPPYKWNFTPHQSFTNYFHQVSNTIGRMANEIPIFHYQWCRDHDKNYAGLKEMLADTLNKP